MRRKSHKPPAAPEALIKVHDSLDREERRFIREGVETEQKLAVYDLLSKHLGEITKGDIAKIKSVAMALMATVGTQRLALGDLRDRASAQAQMKTAIIDRLLEGLPDGYSSEDIDARAEVVYQYVSSQLQSMAVH